MNNVVSGNYIGTDVSGTGALGNGLNGVQITHDASSNLIGGDTVGERNLISGNSIVGVYIRGSGTMNNTVSGNYIGTDANGTTSIPNSGGISIVNGASHNTIGGPTVFEGNTIANNAGDGVWVNASSTLSNTISHNSIHSNAGKGIELTDGGNRELAPPVITQLISYDIVSGTACAGCSVEIFSDDAEEGRIYEGTTAADGSGQFGFSKPGGFTGPNVTATATDAGGNTSEFSIPVTPPSISQIMPNQGTNDVPNEINVTAAAMSLPKPTSSSTPR
jgi:hypothetical protein